MGRHVGGMLQPQASAGIEPVTFAVERHNIMKNVSATFKFVTKADVSVDLQVYSNLKAERKKDKVWI